MKKYLPYLEDLKSRLYRLTIVFIATFAVAFLSSGFIVKKFIYLFDIKNITVAATSPFQLADLAMDIGIFFAIVVITPLIIYQIFSFVSSAMTPKEKRRFFLLIPASLALFVFGFSYSVFILYYSFNLLAVVNNSLGIKNIWDVSSYLAQTCITSLLLGIIFQFPIVLSALIRLGLVGVDTLKRKRRLVIFLIVVFTSLLPPTDGISLIIMVLPLILLYEATIIINNNKKHV